MNELSNIVDTPNIDGDRKNPLLNFAFCSRFSGNKSCMYIEGDKENQLIIVIHYAVDKYFPKPLIYPILTSDVVILLDTSFMYRLPEGYPHHPFIIEVVGSNSKVRHPYRLNLKFIMQYLSPTGTVKNALDGNSVLSQTYKQDMNKMDAIPKELHKPKSKYSIFEWCMATKEIYDVGDFFVHIVYGADDIMMKERDEFFVYSNVLKKCINFFQLVERKFAVIVRLLSFMTLINLIEAADRNRIKITSIPHLLLEMLTICRIYTKKMLAAARKHYSSIFPFGKQEPKTDELNLLDKAALRQEISIVESLKVMDPY